MAILIISQYTLFIFNCHLTNADSLLALATHQHCPISTLIQSPIQLCLHACTRNGLVSLTPTGMMALSLCPTQLFIIHFHFSLTVTETFGLDILWNSYQHLVLCRRHIIHYLSLAKNLPFYPCDQNTHTSILIYEITPCPEVQLPSLTTETRLTSSSAVPYNSNYSCEV